MTNDTLNIPRQNSYTATLTQVLEGDAAALTIFVDTVPLATIPTGTYLEMTINPKRNFDTQEVVLVESINSINSTMTIKTDGRAQPRYNGDTPTPLEHRVGSLITLSNPYSLWIDIEAALEGKVSSSEGGTLSGNYDFTPDDPNTTFRIPNMTEAERDNIPSPENGMLIYNTTAGEFQYYDGGTWQSVGMASVPNASETVAGIVELATNAEMGAGTSIGGTGARLVPPNSQLVKTSSGAGDENKIPVLNSSGQLDGGFVDLTAPTGSFPAGEAVDGTTTPQVVYISDGSGGRTAGRFYKADVNDLTNMAVRKIGFVTVNAATPGTNYPVQISGIVSGFSGLTQGVDYFLSTTAGAIDNDIISNPVIKVGRAASATQLRILDEAPSVISTSSTALVLGSNATQDLQISLGFRPRCCVALSSISASADRGVSSGLWNNGQQARYEAYRDTTNDPSFYSSSTGAIGVLYEDVTGDQYVTISVLTFDDNTITIRFTAGGGGFSATANLYLLIFG